MKFNITSGEYYPYDFDNLVKDYMNPTLSVKQIREKYNLSVGMWHTALKRLKEAEVPMRGYNTPKPVEPDKHYYYSKSHKRFYVYKYIDGANRVLAGFPNAQLAEECVRLFEEYGWDEKDKVLEEMGV